MALRPIHHTFAPHVDMAYALRSLGLLLRPWTYRAQQPVARLRDTLSRSLQGDIALFLSGREALLALLKALNVQKGDEVIVQAYTCIVVPNAIAAAGATPVYADIEQETLNLDPEAVEKLMSAKTKAVICQHTFGIPAPLSELKQLCRKHGIPLIEDCAHVLPDQSGPLGIATTGTYALLSFGRDKAISGVAGGGMLSRNPEVTEKLRALEAGARHIPRSVTFRLLLYPLLYAIARPLYGLGIGKALLFAAGKLTLLIPIVTAAEKKGMQPQTLHRMPGSCAVLALREWKRIGAINGRRRKIAAMFLTEGRRRKWPIVEGACAGLPLQKLPLFVPDAEAIRKKLHAQNIHLHDGWTGCVVCPEAADASSAGYKDGSDPAAEKACKAILSLPVHPTMTVRQAKALIKTLDPFLQSGQ